MKAKCRASHTRILLGLLFLFHGLSFQLPLFASPSGWHLLNVKMQDRNSGWAIANSRSGVSILHTNDTGETWNNVSPKKFWPQSAKQIRYNYNSSHQNVASFCSAKDCWVCFVTVIAPSTGKPLVPANLSPYTLAGLDAGKVELFHTEDAGRHWATNTFVVPRALGGGAVFLNFADRRTGYLLATSSPAAGKAYSWIYRTLDSGQKWTKVYDNYPEFHKPEDVSKSKEHLDYAQNNQKTRDLVGSIPTGVVFKDRLSGWIGTFSGRSSIIPLFHTIDGAKNWTLQPLPAPDSHGHGNVTIFSPMFFGDDRLSGILPTYCADAKSAGCIFYLTSDGGNSWKAGESINLHTEVSRLAYCFVDKNDGFALDGTSKVIFKTVDGGLTWAGIKTEPPLGNSVFSLNSRHQLDFVDADHGWCLYDAYDENTHSLSNVLVMTQNGGKDWRRVYSSVQAPPRDRGVFY